ncbi:uncharacterized protein LOC106181940 [Lingula anatina]|uniref:Uncharacterized protein LOC106181940 n=1 Tax=Lingula anatina TaxID=7574 RepID=A0A1S3KH56_LINAN|nr:uncharacterized protein LOC106181940 [Lingula anatina]|eukprot:XP_013421963.1 uncharacterized protein LOC106181940 [Lingula anatina]
MWNTIQVVAFLLCVNVMYSHALWIPTGRRDEINFQEYPGGIWFGTQDLACVSKIRAKRFVFRSPIRIAHRLIYYRGLIFEWGVGNENSEKRYSYRDEPYVPHCEVRWEIWPAAESTCSIEAAKAFTRSYKSRFGDYNLFGNNCHMFAMRLAGMLKNGDC